MNESPRSDPIQDLAIQLSELCEYPARPIYDLLCRRIHALTASHALTVETLKLDRVEEIKARYDRATMHQLSMGAQEYARKIIRNMSSPGRLGKLEKTGEITDLTLFLLNGNPCSGTIDDR